MSDLDEDTITITSNDALEPVAHSERASPRLVVVLDGRKPSMPGLRLSLVGLRSVLLARGSMRLVSHAPVGSAALFLADQELSRQHARLVPGADGWEIHDLESKNGTLVNGERIERVGLGDGDIIEVGSTLLVYRDDACPPTDRDLANEALSHLAFRSVVPAVEAIAGKLGKIARSSVPVLVWGETGAGKELVARAIHDGSGRTGELVPVNCGSLPKTLIESELFGHKRGAFSGARDDHDGLVRRADGGTLFLDEIAELPEESQVALLRVLQEGEVRSVGASETVRVDVRVVAATHQDLKLRIADGRFRSDLYARLAGFEAELVPLRERREDLGTIIAALLPRLAPPVTVHRSAARALFSYLYPLNVRELEQALRSAAVLADGGEIRIEHLPAVFRAQRAPGMAVLGAEERALRERVVQLLREHNGNVMAAAREMNRAPVQIRRWCRRFGVDVADFRRSITRA